MAFADTLPQCDKWLYVIEMDNYFTTSTVIKNLHESNIGVVGTAHAQRGWPLTEFKNVKEEHFNCVHLLNDPGNFPIMSWVDNNVVTMISTVHTGEETVT